MTEDKEASNDNDAKTKIAKKILNKQIYADVSKLHDDPPGKATTKNKEVVHWNIFSPK